MLKRIHVEDLTLGMYLHEFCGSWMDHPFWRTKFVLNDPRDLERIRATSVQEVWIDTDRGKDVARGRPALSPEEVEERIQTDFGQLADLPPFKLTEPAPPPPPQRDLRPSSTQAELQRAARICSQSKVAVRSMFQEARMGKAVDAEAAAGLVQDIADSVARNPGALISLARLKTADEYTYMHSVAVCALMVALARQIGLNDTQTRTAGLAGLLHDLGKAAVPLAVLNKAGKLTDEEFTLVKSHPLEGWGMLREGQGAEPAGRPYKRGWDPAESIRRMADWTRGHFDPRLFQAFVKGIGIYPVGSLVRLESGRIGVVLEQNPASLVTPKVRVFFSTKSDLRIPPEAINLAAPGCNDRIVAREDPEKWRFPDLHTLWSGIEGQPW